MVSTQAEKDASIVIANCIYKWMCEKEQFDNDSDKFVFLKKFLPLKYRANFRSYLNARCVKFMMYPMFEILRNILDKQGFRHSGQLLMTKGVHEMLIAKDQEVNALVDELMVRIYMEVFAELGLFGKNSSLWDMTTCLAFMADIVNTCVTRCEPLYPDCQRDDKKLFTMLIVFRSLRICEECLKSSVNKWSWQMIINMLTTFKQEVLFDLEK